MDEKSKKRLLSLKEKMQLASWMEEMAQMGAIECESIVQLAEQAAKMLGKPAGSVSDSSLQTISQELGITIRSMSSLSLPHALKRIAELEKRVDELERIFIEKGVAAYGS